jgi:hypothetical protein
MSDASEANKGELSDTDILQIATEHGEQISHLGSVEWSFVDHANVVALVRACISRDRELRRGQ